MPDQPTKGDALPAARLQNAFHWIAEQRAADPATPLEPVLAQAQVRYQLTPAELSWVRWTLEPQSVALQSKEPETKH